MGGSERGVIISGERSRTRADFDDRVLRVAGGLAALGVTPGDFVAILMRNDTAFLEASFAAIRLGAYPVPINWHFKGEEIGYILRDCGARALIGHADLIRSIGNAIPAEVAVIEVEVPAEVAQAYGIGDPRAAPGARDFEGWLSASAPWRGPVLPPLQSMIYTSGTTGNPKGVRRQPPNEAQSRYLAGTRERVYGLKAGVRAMVPGPLYHSAPNAFALRGLPVADLFLVMPRFEPEVFLALVEKHRIDTVFMVPTMFVRLLKLPEAVRRRYDLSSLRFIMHAAAPCPVDVKRQIIDWFGPIVWEFYGATESGAVTIISAEDWLRRPGSVGRPSEGAVLRIIDDAGREVPAGEVGEVFSRIALYPEFTYHNLPEKRREIERDGFITVGDMGYVDADGFLFICDRKRDMVISGGVNIYPAEIESAALTLAGVKDCAVFGIPDPEFGEALMAIVEPEAGHALTIEDVRRHLTARLAGYKVPRRIELGRDLPREDSGKIFKRRLREPFWQGAGRRI